MNKGLWSLILVTMLMLFSNASWAATACKVKYTISNEWNTGFSTVITLTNTGDPWTNWTTSWDMPDGQKMTGIWNASYTQNGATVSIKNAGWNANVASGANVQFGFNGSHTGLNNIPSNVSVNGVLCDGNPPPPPPPVTSCEVLYSVPTVWGSGFTADVMLKNTGDTLGDWTITWDMPDGQQVTELWNANHQQSGSQVSVTPLEWNRYVPENGLIEFGFNGSHVGLNNIPGNIALNGVKCAGQVDPPPPPPPSCTVQYRVQNQWNNGFTATVDIKNTGAPWNGWETTWTMPTGQIVTGGWNGRFSQTGDKVSVQNIDFNKIIGPYNDSISYGFNASHTGLNLLPIDIAVNGTRCDGQPDTLVLPPNAPGNLQATLTDNTHVDLNWQDNSDNEDNLVLERREAGTNWTTLATLDANTLTYRDSTLLIGKLYEYRLKAVNSTASSAYTNIVSVQRQDRTDIRAPMMANSCASCHSTNGVSVGPSIPSISGLNRDYFVRTMKAYKTGTRASSIMDRVAKGYTDTQIERMADYFSGMTFAAAEQTTDQTLVDKGRGIHESRCIFCHTGTGADDSLTKTRLDGQWATYLHATLEDYSAGRSSNIPSGMADQMTGLKDLFGADALQALAEYYAASATAKAGNNDNTDGNGGTDTGGSGGDTGTGDSGGDTGTGGDTGGSGDTTVPPSAPGSAASNVVNNSVVNLSWTDTSNNEDGFRIERRVSGTTGWEAVTTTAANIRNYADNQAAMGNTYEYRITAFNSAGDSDSVTTTATLLTLLKYGEQQYQQQSCASCHGPDGKGGFTHIDLTKYTAADMTSLAGIIRDTMPPGNPGACVGTCADSIASYIIDYLVPNAGSDGDSNAQACAGTPPASARSLRLLTRLEYQNTVNDLFGLSLNLVNNLPDENQVGGFDNNIEQNQVSSLRLDAYLTQAEKIAAQAVQDSWSKIMPCSQQDTACARQFIQTFGKRAFRRPLTTAEVDNYAANFTNVTFKDAVEKSVMAMLVSPNFLYRSELGELQADGTYKLTPYEVASSLSYLFWGSMPDDALFQAADNNALDTSAQRISQASRLLASPRSREQTGNFVGQWLLKTSPYSLPAKDASVYPAYTDTVKAALSQELINFFNYVTFDSTQSFRELYTADYVIANKTLADFYHLSGPVGNTFEKTPVTDSSRTGLLTLGSVLARYSNSNESHPFKRGRFFFERVLCHELPEPANFGLVQPPDTDPTATTRDRFEFHSQSFPSCYSCHQYLDGPGFGFENYDGAGQFRTEENGTVIDASAILRGMETYSPDEEITFNDLSHLSQLTADSPTAAQCVARQYYRYTTGRQETTADQCTLDNYLQTYQDSGYNLQTMLISIVNAPNFTLRRAQ